MLLTQSWLFRSTETSLELQDCNIDSSVDSDSESISIVTHQLLLIANKKDDDAKFLTLSPV